MEKIMSILSDLRPDIDFTAQERLIDEGILDSFDVIALVSELNDSFDIDIGAGDLLPENFNSAAAIAALVARLSA